MAQAAAFFDLDRTLLAGASGPLLNVALRDVGVLNGRDLPGQSLVFKAFELIGETRPTMMATRELVRLAQGRDPALFRKAGELAAAQLVDEVLPHARGLIEEHQAAGRPVVLATTTPHDLVGPFAKALGLDDVVATRYQQVDGVFNGSIDGEFVWGRGKLRAVQRWAKEHHVDLRQSWAYSDSYYDVPLLSAVGYPTAVNPDPRMLVASVLRRWPVLWLDVPPGVPKIAGVEPQQAALLLARPELFPYARFEISGVENVPETGAAIVVGNHRSYFDPVAVGVALARRGRPIRFLGKKEVFDAPVVGEIARALGGIRVERGSGSDEPLRAAEVALNGGELVALMPQGTIPRGQAFFDPELKGRWGAARLAQLTGAPVIPMGVWGTEKVWPRSSRVPYVHNVLNPPTITVTVGRPVRLAHQDLDEDTKKVMRAITRLLPPEGRRKVRPTPEQLARTYPHGAAPTEGEHEAARRPGTD